MIKLNKEQKVNYVYRFNYINSITFGVDALDSEETAQKRAKAQKKGKDLDFSEVQGMSKEEILNSFYEVDTFTKDKKAYKTPFSPEKLKGRKLSFDLVNAADKKEKANPRNGLCLNALHDKAFDLGFITVDKDSLRIVVAETLKSFANLDETTKKWIVACEGEPIILPHRSTPDKLFLEYHNDVVFRG